MPVPISTTVPRFRRSLAWLTLLLALPFLLPAAGLRAARMPKPSERIPLEPLGFQPLTSRYLLGGSSMLTLHYVDQKHLLLTFGARRLIHRTPNDPPYDQDRNVDVLLLELPSGKILARTEWLLHDHAQYLWNLGNGQFLFRIRDELSTFAPLANLQAGNAFVQRPFLRSTRHMAAVLLSQDAALLTVETTEPLDPTPDSSSQRGDEPTPPKPNQYQLNFYRLSRDGTSPGTIVPHGAGGALARHPVLLPITPAGTLQVVDQGHQRWGFDFHTHAGKVTELGLFESTCRPVPFFVSPSEFVAFGCRGGTMRQWLAGFNLRGEATWLQNLPGPYIAPFFVYAPAAGRFALGRIVINAAAVGIDSLDPAMVASESVDVIQNDSGDTVLHIDCSPIARAGQNFALSPDGLSLAVLREGAIEIYPLPPLGAKEQKAVLLAQQTAPPASGAAVDLSSFRTSSEESTENAEDQPDPPLQSGQSAAAVVPADQPPIPAPVSPKPEPPPATAQTPARTVENGDQHEERRKPPSLYSPDAPDPNRPPQQ